MGTTEQQQNQELDAIKDSLGNNKLDKQEVNFLKSQKELFLDFKDTAEKSLLTDIKETNKISFDGSEKVRQILNAFWMKSDTFVDQLVLADKLAYKDKKNIALYKNNLKVALTNAPDDFTKQSIILKILFEANTGNVYHKFVYAVANKGGDVFDVQLVKDIHKFQSQYASASSKGWSEADCIVGQKTIQSLCSKLGITPNISEVQIDAKFSQSNFSAKEEYNRANESQSQIDSIMKDVGISSLQKIKNMVDVCKKTTTKASDGTDKRYGAVVYMINRIQIMLPNMSEQERQSALQELSPFSKEITKYWNTGNSNTMNQKSDDFLKDLNTGIEKNEGNKRQLDVILSLAETWISYYKKESPKAYEKVASKIDLGINQLKTLKNTSTDITSQIKKALGNIFRDTEFARSESFGGQLINTIVGGGNAMNGMMMDIQQKSGQYLIFGEITNILTDTKNDWKDENKIKGIRSKILNKFRLIDAKFDSKVSILDGYNSGEAILGEIENQEKNQKIGTLAIDTKGVSIKDGFVEYGKFNTDIAKVNTIFAKLDQKEPDPTTLQNMEEIMKLLDSSTMSAGGMVGYGEHQIYVPGELQINIGAIHKFKELFGFTLPIGQRKMLYKTLGEINQHQKEMVKNSMNDFKDKLQLSNKELQENILRYQSEIDHIKSKNPSDPRINEYETNILQMKEGIINNQNGIAGKAYKSAKNPNDLSQGIETTTIHMQAEASAKNMSKYMFIKALEKTTICAVMENNEAVINKLKNKSNKNASESLLDLYANIKGVGSYRSDETYNTVLEVSKEIVIQVAICAISAGVGNLVLKGAIAGTKRALTIGDTVRGVNMANKLGKFYKIGTKGFSTIKRLNTLNKLSTSAKVLNYTKAVASRALNLTIEGTAFHASSTILNNTIAGNNMFDGLALTGQTVIGYDESGNPITHSNIRGYIQSIAFLGIIKAVGGPIQKSIADKFTKGTITQTELNGVLNQTVKLSKGQKIIMNTASLGGEFASMYIADQAISLSFDGETKEMSTKDLIHMAGMIIGLRLTHKLNIFGGVNKKLEDYIIKDIKRDANGNIGDLKISSGGKEKWVSELKLEGKKPVVAGEKLVVEGEKVIVGGEKQIVENSNNTNKQKNIEELQLKNSEKKSFLEKEIESLNARKNELKIQRQLVLENKISGNVEFSIREIENILSKGNKVSIDGKKYQYLGIVEGKMKFGLDGVKLDPNPLSFSSMKELADLNVNFNLKNTQLISGKKKQALFLELLAKENLVIKKRPGEIKKQLNNLEGEKSRLELEIKNIEKQNNSYNQNDFFSQNKDQLLGENFWRDGQKNTVSNITKNGDIRITNNITGETFTINSFKQLAEKGGIQFFAEQGAEKGSTKLTKGEKLSQEKWNNLKQGEELYMTSRSTTLLEKRSRLSEINENIVNKNNEYIQSQQRQNKIQERANNLANINKEINNIETQLLQKNNQYQETVRLEKKYETDLNQLSASEPQTPNTEVVQPKNEGETEIQTTTEKLIERFDLEILSPSGITIDGKNYKLEYKENMTQNQNRKGERKRIVDGKTEISGAKSNTRVLPDNAAGNLIRQKYTEFRDKFLAKEKSVVKIEKPVKVASLETQKNNTTIEVKFEKYTNELEIAQNKADNVFTEAYKRGASDKELESIMLKAEKDYVYPIKQKALKELVKLVDMKKINQVANEQRNLYLDIVGSDTKLFDKAILFETLSNNQKLEMAKSIIKSVCDKYNISSPEIKIEEGNFGGETHSGEIKFNFEKDCKTIDRFMEVISHETIHHIDNFAPSKGALGEDIARIGNKYYINENIGGDLYKTINPTEISAFKIGETVGSGFKEGLLAPKKYNSVPKELLNIDGKEFSSELGTLENLKNIGKYELAKIETNDGGWYEIKPLGKDKYEVIESNPKMPKGQKVGIIKEEGTVDFLDEGGNVLAIAVKTIKKVDILRPVTKENKTIKYYDEIIKIPTGERDSKLSKNVRNKIDEFKKNSEGKLYIEKAYNNLDIMLIRKDGQTLITFIDKNSPVGEPPKNFPLTEEQISISDKEKFEHIIGYAGSLGGSFTTKNFEAKSHYGQAFNDSYQGKGLAGLARNIKEYTDGILQNDYSGKLSNTQFLIKRGYYPKNYVDGQGNIIKMSSEQQNILKKSLQEKNSEDLPFTVQLEYNKAESEKYLLEIQKSKTEKNDPETNKVKKKNSQSKERFNLRKMNPDTQKVVDKLLVKYPKLEPLFDSMIVKDYDSALVQQHLSDLNLLPEELITKIREKTIVFFISNEGVTSWPRNSELIGVTPRGREESGLKRDDVAGLADEVGGVCAGKGEHGAVSLVLHELGHQIDLRGIINTKEIQPLYEKIKTEKNLNAYFLQKGEAGLQEFFAETFGEYYKLPKSEFIEKYGKEYYQKLQEKFSKNKLNPEIVKANSKLNDTDRILTAKKLPGLEKITTVQEQAILDAHNQPGEIYNLNFSQIKVRLEILKNAGFTSEQIRTLMENGICGKNTRDIVLKTINPIKKMLMSGNVDWALTKIEKYAPSEALVVTEMPSNHIDAFYSIADKVCNTFYGFEISDVTLFLGKLKMLRDAAAGATILYTEKLQQKNDMQEVVANARLSWEPRVKKGWEIIEKIGDIKLDETQKEIMKKTIMKAHTYGHSEAGKNGEPASIYNYTMHQLGVKMYTLMEGMERCGIEGNKAKDIAKEVLRKGICGEVQN